MTRLLDFLLSCWNYFDSLKPRRGDDHLTATFKSRQWGIITSVIYLALVFVAGFGAAGLLDSLGASPLLAGLVDGLRQPAGYLLLAALAFFTIRLCLAGWSLLRFLRAGV